MKQIWLTKSGRPEILELRDVPEPTPGAGEIRVHVKAAGINFADCLIRMGVYPGAPKPPMVLGFELAGVVDRVGTGVTSHREGDRVMAFALQLGGYSEKLVIPAMMAAPVPKHLSDAQAGAVPVVYTSAWMMLVRLGNIQPGESVLIHSAGGGVGIAAAQIAKWKGARIIGSASRHKHARLKELGYDQCIDYLSEDVEQETKRLTDGRGADLILDPNGGSSFGRSYRSLAPMGRLIIYGASSLALGKTANPIPAILGLMRTPKFKPMDMFGANKSIMTFWLGGPGVDGNKLGADFGEVVKLLHEKVLQPIVDKAFPFERVADAHHYMQDRKNFGKLVLVP